MTKKLTTMIVGMVAVVALFASTASPKSSIANYAEKARGFSFQKNGRALVKRQMATPEMEAATFSSRNIGTRSSLGNSAAYSGIASPGITVDNTYDDWQWSHNRRRIDFRGTPDVHFVYTDQKLALTSAAGTDDVIGYNVYNPLGGGNWPQGVEVGCVLSPQDGTTRGVYPNMDINPDGFIFIGGHVDVTGGTSFDNNFFWQNSQFSCFFGSGATIPDSQYTIGMAAPTTSAMNHPAVDVQIIGADTVQHVLGHESAFAAVLSSANGATGVVMQYFRKVGWGVAGAWTGPETIGAGQYRGSLTSSRVGPEVAVAWIAPSPLGLTDPTTNPNGENDIYIKESVDGGVSWPATATNITNYDRSVESLAPWIETNSIYDTQGRLHVIWNGNPWPAGVYDSASFFFGDFSADLYHWSDANPGTLSRIMSANYTLAANTQVCGFGGFNMLYMGFFDISECDGNMYTTWSQLYAGLDLADVPATDDCTDLSPAYVRQTGRLALGNREIFMSVSSGLDGLLWDEQRNITNSPSNTCDSATGNGVCMDDTRGSLSRYGMDEAAMTATFGALTWPGTELVDLSPGQNYAGGFYLQLMYLEDHLPGNGTLDGSGPAEQSLNPLKWVRLACVNPVTAPRIAVSTQSIGFPDFTKHGIQKDITITVTNDGNTGLNISSLITEETGGPTGWLTTSVPSLTVPAGATNTATFSIGINTGGIVNAPGTVVQLPGRVRIVSDAPIPNDTVDITISYIVADTVVGVIFDTVGTGTTMLTMSNHGNMGNGGIGGANMDYTDPLSAMRDCDTNQTVYMFGGSPFIIQEITPGTSYKFSNSFGQSGFAANFAFKPVIDFATSGSMPTAAYDHFFTGTFVSSDTTIAVERDFYAPLGGAPNDDFVVVRTRFFSTDGSMQTGLLLGDQIDWDIPTEIGATNVSGIKGKTVYQQGVDTGAVATGCVPYASRFGGSSFLGMYTSTEFGADACANSTARWGIYAERNDSGIFNAPNGVMDSAKVWTKAGAKTGEWAEPSTTDLHIVQSYVWDYTLAAGETLTVYTAMTTVKSGTVDDLNDNVLAACDWYNANLRPGCSVCSCCKGVTGNVDNDPNDISDITDLTVLIDHLFINFPVLECPAEANVDGDLAGLVDITDLTFLIDHLFINFPENSPCQ